MLGLCSKHFIIILMASSFADGQNNDIDFTANNFVSGTITIQQLNNNNDIDVTVTAGSGSGSWLTIYQNGNDTYNANLWCNHSWCGMTVDQR